MIGLMPPENVEHVLIVDQGSVADSIVRAARSTGGILSMDDLANYTVLVDRALQGSYRGKKVYTSHAPTSGPGRWLFIKCWKRLTVSSLAYAQPYGAIRRRGTGRLECSPVCRGSPLWVCS